MKKINKILISICLPFVALQALSAQVPKGYEKEHERMKKMERIAKEREGYQPPDVSLVMEGRKIKYHGKLGIGKPLPSERDPLPEAPQSSEQVTQSEFRAVDYLVKLPDCKFAETKRLELGEVSEAGKSFDYLFYSFTDPDQQARAESWPGLAVPYYAPKNKEQAEETFITALQFFAVQYGVSCLPTRMHVLSEEDGRSYLEYRMGEEAWEK